MMRLPEIIGQPKKINAQNKRHRRARSREEPDRPQHQRQFPHCVHDRNRLHGKQRQMQRPKQPDRLPENRRDPSPFIKRFVPSPGRKQIRRRKIKNRHRPKHQNPGQTQIVRRRRLKPEMIPLLRERFHLRLLFRKRNFFHQHFSIRLLNRRALTDPMSKTRDTSAASPTPAHHGVRHGAMLHTASGN